MSPQDHNKTLAIIYLLLSGFFTLPLIVSPWIIAKNIDQYPSPRRSDQILIAILFGGAVLFLAVLFWSTSLGLYWRKAWGRKMALIASVVLFPLCLPIAAYTWWFMHSEGGKQLYGHAPNQFTFKR